MFILDEIHLDVAKAIAEKIVRKKVVITVTTEVGSVLVNKICLFSVQNVLIEKRQLRNGKNMFLNIRN